MSSITYRKARTLKNCVSFSGIGIHTGDIVNISLLPAPEKTGVIFKRIDLPGKPLIPATLEYVCDHRRNTTLGIQNVHLFTVEHLLAAIKAYKIDNLLIEIDAVEPPVGNGSSDIFIEMIEKVGIQEQAGQVPIVKLQNPVYWSDKEIHLVALPYDGYKISYTLHYPDTKVLASQYFSIDITTELFKHEIAPCRTFSLYEEVSTLIDNGLIKGGSLSNAVVIKDQAIFSKNGLFFRDEMVRHKILDVIGDLSLVGIDFQAHVIAIRSGHASNYLFAKKIFNSIAMENNYDSPTT